MHVAGKLIEPQKWYHRPNDVVRSRAGQGPNPIVIAHAVRPTGADHGHLPCPLLRTMPDRDDQRVERGRRGKDLKERLHLTIERLRDGPYALATFVMRSNVSRE